MRKTYWSESDTQLVQDLEALIRIKEIVIQKYKMQILTIKARYQETEQQLAVKNCQG